MKNLATYTTRQRLQKLVTDLEMSLTDYNNQDINSTSWRTRTELLSQQSRVTLEEISFNSYSAGRTITQRGIIELILTK